MAEKLHGIIIGGVEYDLGGDSIPEITSSQKTADHDEKIVIETDNGEKVAEVNEEGIVAKNFIYLNGKKVGASSIYYILDANGGGDFLTLQEAIEKAPELSTIVVAEGVYDIRNLHFNKGQSFIGVNKARCIFRNPALFKNSPGVANGYFKNLTWDCPYVDPQISISAGNMQNYTIHIDMVRRYDGIPFKIHFEDCIIKNENGDCFGCGGTKDLEIFLDRCEIILDGWCSNAACFGIHNVANVTPGGELDGAALVKIHNSVLRSNRLALRMGSTNMTTEGVEYRTMFELINNTFYSTFEKDGSPIGSNCIGRGSILGITNPAVVYLIDEKIWQDYRLSPVSNGNNVSSLNN